MAEAEAIVKTWQRRIDAAKAHKKTWVDENRVETCYAYWRGQQRGADEFDGNSQRRAQINKIHPEVANSLPSLYFYRPFATLTAEPEEVDDPDTDIEGRTQLLQDTANHLIRDTSVDFRDSTYMALKEAHWAFGCVEVGYSADFLDTATADRPPLKENEKTKVGKGAPPEEAPLPEAAMDPMTPMDAAAPPALEIGPDGLPLEPEPIDEMASLAAELAKLKGSLKSERFFVKFIPSRQVLISVSDKPFLKDNDWVGYYEDVPLEDVKRSTAYENLAGLKASTGNPDEDKKQEAHFAEIGDSPNVRLYKLWDLRTRTRYVFAEGHDKCLLKRPFKRLGGLKFLRFDIDPYHFFPRPPLLSKLDPQDEYNQSREYLRLERISRVARFTYDESGMDASQMRKLETGEMGVYVPRHPGNDNPITPIQQPAYSDGAMATLSLSSREMAEVGGVGGDAKVAQSKTATQAKIGEAKEQAQDSFQRYVVADFLSSVVDELLRLSIDNMNLDQVAAMNIAPDSPVAAQIDQQIRQQFQTINAEILSDAQAGVTWSVGIDIDSLSPVSEQIKFEKWMRGLEMLSNPPMARLFSVAPPLLAETLKLMGIRDGRRLGMLSQAMQAMVQLEQQLAAQGQNAAPGMPSQPNQAGPGPGGPKGPPAGGPQPGPPPQG